MVQFAGPPAVNYIYSNDKSFNSELINWSNCINISDRLFSVIYVITDQIYAAHTPKSNIFNFFLSRINSGIGYHTSLDNRTINWGEGYKGFPIFDPFFRSIIVKFIPAHLKAKLMANIYSVQQDICTNRLTKTETIIPNLVPYLQF